MTTYINLDTNEYPRYVGDIALWPGNYAEVVWVNPPEVDGAKQCLLEGMPTLTDGVWYTTWVVRDWTQTELDEIAALNLTNTGATNEQIT
jgi:hypothetical protein